MYGARPTRTKLPPIRPTLCKKNSITAILESDNYSFFHKGFINIATGITANKPDNINRIIYFLLPLGNLITFINLS